MDDIVLRRRRKKRDINTVAKNPTKGLILQKTASEASYTFLSAKIQNFSSEKILWNFSAKTETFLVSKNETFLKFFHPL